MAELIVRGARAEDAVQMAELEKICFASPWSYESLLYDITENHLAAYLVAEVEGKIAGYVGIWTIVDEGHITNVAVAPEFRRKHVGSCLISNLIQVTEQAGITSHTLEVRAGNEPAKGLYRKFGFVPEGIRKGYYEDNGEDAIIMWRKSCA